MTSTKRVGLATLALGLATLIVGFTSGVSAAAEPEYDVHIAASAIGAENPGYVGPATGTCWQGDDAWVWRFDLRDGQSTFLALELTFEHAGVISVSGGDPAMATVFVETPGPDTLLAARADVDGPATEFVLKYVCEGTTPATTTTEAVTTTTEAVTTTTEETTTTEAPTTTTIAAPTSTSTSMVTTTTGEVLTSTTVAGPTTTEAAPTTTTGEVLTTTVESTPTTTVSSTSNQTLARTGSSLGGLVALGSLLLLAGAVLVLRARAAETA